MNFIRRWFKGSSLPVTYGEKAMKARREVLEVRINHAHLREAWLQAETSEAQDRIEALMQTELAKLTEIENRYFKRNND